ncbi:hypothetical protein LTR85_002651 [Meristemomyces frigidus]|nr:hypothetical protein LTR85_002651 [Meristemomyces frigidus]
MPNDQPMIQYFHVRHKSKNGRCRSPRRARSIVALVRQDPDRCYDGRSYDDSSYDRRSSDRRLYNDRSYDGRSDGGSSRARDDASVHYGHGRRSMFEGYISDESPPAQRRCVEPSYAAREPRGRQIVYAPQSPHPNHTSAPVEVHHHTHIVNNVDSPSPSNHRRHRSDRRSSSVGSQSTFSGRVPYPDQLHIQRASAPQSFNGYDNGYENSPPIGRQYNEPFAQIPDNRTYRRDFQPPLPLERPPVQYPQPRITGSEGWPVDPQFTEQGVENGRNGPRRGR